MISAMAQTVGRSIVRHPWSSLRDAVLLSSLMVFAVLLAWRYDLFAFLTALADPQREISPPEAVLLTILFVSASTRSSRAGWRTIAWID